MVVGLLTARLAVYGATSLKDKRRVIKSLKDKIRNKFNVSIAEVDAQDSRQRAVLAAAVVATDTQFAQSSLQQLLNMIRGYRGSTLIDYEIDIL